MDNLFVLIFLLTPVLWIVLMFKPGLIKRFFKKTLTRKQISLLSLGLFVSSFVLVAITTDVTVDEKTDTSKTKIENPVEQIDEEAIDGGGEVDKEVDKQKAEEVKQELDKVIVTRVIDGDTVELADGRKVRYIGVDTPETVDPNKAIQCFGYEASEKNKELVLNKEVRLEKDVSDVDRYGRLLRYIWLGDVMVNETLVRQGYAQSSTYQPDVKYQNRFLEAQRLAREEGRGLWSVCSYFGEEESAPEVTQPSVTQPTVSGECQYNCSGPDRDCSDFSTHVEAQTFFNCCGFTATNDPMRLDARGVGNGIACESLP